MNDIITQIRVRISFNPHELIIWLQQNKLETQHLHNVSWRKREIKSNH